MHESPPIGLALVVCEFAKRDCDGRLSLLGIVNRVVADSFPVILPSLAVYLALTDARPGSRCQINIVDGSTDSTVFQLADFELPAVDDAEGTGVIELEVGLEPFPLAFEGPGTYLVQVLGNGQVVLQRPILIEAAGIRADL